QPRTDQQDDQHIAVLVVEPDDGVVENIHRDNCKAPLPDAVRIRAHLRGSVIGCRRAGVTVGYPVCRPSASAGRRWYSGLGTWPIAEDIRLVKLYIAAT